jgi:Major Facilitator Superfamily
MKLQTAQLANSIGDGVFLVTSALYFTRVVGFSATQVGLALTVGWGAGLLAGVPLGHIADRRGPRGTAVALAVATAAAVGSLLVARTFVAFLAAVLLYTVSQCGLAAARQALLAGLVAPADRTRVRAQLQATANAGLAIGAAFGGAALYFDTPTAYLLVLGLDAVSLLAAAVLLGRLPAVPRVLKVAGEPALAVLRDRPYAVIAGLNAVLLLYMPLLSIVIPLWIVNRTEAPRWSAAALLILNTVSVVLFQVRVARRANGLRSASRLIRYAGVLLLASCVVFALSAYGTSAWSAALVLLAAGVLQVFGEMMLASGSWEISFGLAPADKQGQYQGFFGTGTAVARMVGPLLLTTLVIGWGTPGLLVVGLLFLAAALATTPAVRAAERHTGTVVAPPAAEALAA